MAASDCMGVSHQCGGTLTLGTYALYTIYGLFVVRAHLEEFKESHGRSTVCIRGVQATNDGVDL